MKRFEVLADCDAKDEEEALAGSVASFMGGDRRSGLRTHAPVASSPGSSGWPRRKETFRRAGRRGTRDATGRTQYLAAPTFPLTAENTVAATSRRAETSKAKLWPERYPAAKSGESLCPRLPMKSW